MQTSNWLILESSSFSSKTDMGARKIIALTSMKYGCHTPRFRRLSDEGPNTYLYDCTHERSRPSNVVKNPFAAYMISTFQVGATVNYTPISLKCMKGDTHLCLIRSDIPAHPSSVTAHERRPHLLAHNLDVQCDTGHPRSYKERRKKSSGRESRESKDSLDTHNPG
jgi:hypothetical protein